MGLNWIDRFAINRVQRINPFNINTGTAINALKTIQYYSEKPTWVTLAGADDYERVATHNPIINTGLNILATAASNGKKVIRDINTNEIISWNTKDKAVMSAKTLFVERPNPLQSVREFLAQGVYYKKTFGNRYVYLRMPFGMDKQADITKISAIYNLPSQYVAIKVTGKLFDQVDIENIIDKYELTNAKDKSYKPSEIIHFNEVNISSDLPTIMGISCFDALQMPITNTQLAFEAMNTMLKSRGMQGIIAPKKYDGMGNSVSLNNEEEKRIKDEFKVEYGVLEGQYPFMLSPIALDYYKTTMSAKDLGIYEEFSNNAIIISNGLKIPAELMKTYIQGATYENQVQSVRRLYQDTTIPEVKDEDSYWSFRLNMSKYGFYLDTVWDHIAALAENFKDRATATSLNGRIAKDAYDSNNITWNQYLAMIQLPKIAGGDIYKYERDKQTGDGNKKTIEGGDQTTSGQTQ
jgi:hypothetical protein